jgi:hypothetical protein
MQILFRLFGGVGRAGRKEGRQFADIGLLGGGEVIAICRAAAARAALARLADFALSLCRLLDIAFHGLGSHGLGLFVGSGRSLLDFAFRPETIAIALTVAARRAFAILAILALALLALLARLVALTLFLTLGLHILLLRLGLWRREAGVHLRHIVIKIGIILPFRPLPALGLLGAGDDTEIVFGMLEIILRHYRIAAGLGIARQLQIFLGDMRGIATHLHVRTVALEIAGQRIDVLAATVPAPLPVLVLVIGSHLVALSNSRKISVTLLADRHHAWSGQSR